MIILKSETSSSWKYAGLSRFMFEGKVKTGCIPTLKTFHSMKQQSEDCNQNISCPGVAQECCTMSSAIKICLMQTPEKLCTKIPCFIFTFQFLLYVTWPYFLNCWYSHNLEFGSHHSLNFQVQRGFLWSVWKCVLLELLELNRITS